LHKIEVQSQEPVRPNAFQKKAHSVVNHNKQPDDHTLLTSRLMPPLPAEAQAIVIARAKAAKWVAAIDYNPRIVGYFVHNRETFYRIQMFGAPPAARYSTDATSTTYIFCHATNQQGAEGIMTDKYIKPSKDTARKDHRGRGTAVCFFAQAAQADSEGD
jgi:hypothetical protein